MVLCGGVCMGRREGGWVGSLLPPITIPQHGEILCGGVCVWGRAVLSTHQTTRTDGIRRIHTRFFSPTQAHSIQFQLSLSSHSPPRDRTHTHTYIYIKMYTPSMPKRLTEVRLQHALCKPFRGRAVSTTRTCTCPCPPPADTHTYT